MGKVYGQFIGGYWVPSTSKETFATLSPATGEELARFPQGTREDVDKAVAAADHVFPMWRDTPAPKRAEVLLQAARLMRERKDDLGALVTREMGKVIAEGRGDVQEAIDFFEYVAGEGRRLFGETTTSELRDKFAMTVRLPYGVVGLITPWNFPVAIPAWKIGAAVVSGCTMVFKPASYTPLCAATLVDVLTEAGLPPGVLNMVTGPGSVVGDAIVTDPRVKVVSFTGGVEAGRGVYEKAAHRMAKVGLELGSKNPIIVMEDADLDLAVEGILFAAFGTAGQRCTAASRLIVQQEVYKPLMDKLLKRVEKFRLGDPLDPKVDMGPVVSEDQGKKIQSYVATGRKEGAKLLHGGNRLRGGAYDRGFYLEPTVFEAKHGMRITKEEIFGPILSVIKVKDYKEAVRVANDVEYGLSSSIYTRDVNRAFKATQDLEAGITYINAPTIGAEVHLPFGGIKSTGIGTREAGSTAIEEFTYLKTVFVDYSGRLQKAQIDTDKASSKR